MSSIFKGLNEAFDVQAMQAEYQQRKQDIDANKEAYSEKYGIPLDHPHFVGAVMGAQNNEEQKQKQKERDEIAQQARAKGVASDKANVAGLKKELADLEAKFDPNFEYSDDHTFWNEQKRIQSQIQGLKKRIKDASEIDEAKEADYGPEYQAMVKRVGQMAKEGPRKTVWDPVKRVYKTVPVNAPKKDEGLAEGPGFDKWADERAASQLHKLNIPKTWEVSYDYGPHMTKTVTVKARSEDEAAAKVEKAAEKKGLNIMINSVTPVEQGVAEGSKIAVDRKTGKVYEPEKEFDKLLKQHQAQFQGMAAIEKAQKQSKETKPKQGVAEGSKIAVDRKTGKVYEPEKEFDKLLKQHQAQFQGMAAIEKAQKQSKETKPKQGVAEESEKNPFTNALGRALYRDLSKEKKASPAQVQRNKERWAQRQAEKNKEVDEGYDKWGWHTSVKNGEFMPTKYGNKAYVYLHDLDNESPRGGPQLVTFNKPAHAKKVAAQFGGKVVKTDLNTYRVVKPAEQEVEEDWQKVNKSDKTDGMSRKAVKAYRRENPGSKLKTAVTKKPKDIKKGSSDDKRRKSFCARMKGMKKAHASAKTKRDPDSPINKALRRWHCESVEQMQELTMIAEQKIQEAKNAKQQAAIAIAKKKEKMNESSDICSVCGQTPCNCTHASSIMKGLKGL